MRTQSAAHVAEQDSNMIGKREEREMYLFTGDMQNRSKAKPYERVKEVISSDGNIIVL